MRGRCALEPPPLAPLDHARIDVERLRHLLWNGHHDKACEALGRIMSGGTVNQLVNARMNKRRQMRWSPRGAYRVLQVRAAVLDGRFGHQATQLAA